MANDTGGNVKVDFVWGNVPMQPDDQRSGDGNPTVVSAANASQNNGWSGYSVIQSPVLVKTAISKTLNPGITQSVPNNHSVALNNWNGYPDYTPVPPYLDTTDQAAIPNVVGQLEAAATTALTNAGFVKGAVTTSGVGATVANDGTVRAQTPGAAVVANLGTAVALVKFLAPTVPSVLGLTETAANDALVAVGLVKGAVTVTGTGATTTNDGKVKTQNPVSGGKANTGSSVAIELYQAPTVPSVLGLGNTAAQAAIEAAGLVYAEGATTTDGATVENDGQVASVTPAVGTKVNTGSTATVSLYEFAG